MNEEEIMKILQKMKETVGENNYKLALAITGHRPGKIKDILMCSRDGELLLEYIDSLERQVQKKQKLIDKAVEYINKRFIINEFGEYNLTHTFDKNNVKELLEILKGDNDVEY